MCTFDPTRFTIVILTTLLLVSSAEDDNDCLYAIFKPTSISVLVNSTSSFFVGLNKPSNRSYSINLTVEDADVVSLQSDVVTIPAKWSKMIKVRFAVKKVKSNVIVAENESNWRNECRHHEADSRTLLLISVFRLEVLVLIADVIGWIYFAAWTISFWPQIILNFKRKSVVGLNFDFLALNVTGFLFYSVYNVVMYAVPKVRQEYLEAVPNSVNPVQIQDVAFAVHGFVATLLTIIQCLFYERANQRISRLCIGLLTVAWSVALIAVVVAAFNVITWFIYVTLISYAKLTISIVKYVPQMILNYKRKSTDGFSIGAIFLDFIGGIGSMLQMIVIAYNMDEWSQLFGDFTKFGLGLQSLAFDIVFFVQRFILYGDYVEISETASTNNL